MSNNGKNEFIIVNGFSSSFCDIDPKTIAFLINYYRNKRNYKELCKCLLEPLPNSISSNKENIDLNSKEIYRKNKKLYCKFKNTYL